MGKENDVFDHPSRVQNMNYLFDEDEDLFGAGPSAKGSSAGRPAGAAPGTASSERPRRPQQRSGQAPSARPSQSGRASSDGARPRQVRPKQSRPVSDRTSSAQTPRRVRADEISSPDARAPRKTTPEQANPEQVRPRRVQPSSAGNPRGTRTGNRESYDRINRSSGRSGGGNRRRPRKRSSAFKKVILIYSAVLLVILIVGLIIFSSFLGSLEKSQPTRIAEDVAQNLTAEKAKSFLNSHSDEINCFGDPNDLIDQFVAGMNGVSQVSYIENKDYRAEAPSYDITADGKTIAKLTLEKTGSGSFGLSKWGVSSLDIASYMDMASIEILAPVGAVVTLNGIELDETYAKGQDSVPEVLQTASRYTTIPSYITYQVAGVPGTPEITAKDLSGKDLLITGTADTYVVGSETSQEFIDSVSGLVNNALDAWGRHFINMGGNLSAYILEGSDWYSYIFGGPDMDPIMTSFYEYESIANYSFIEKSAANYIRYTDSCFTVDVKYQMQIDFNNNTMSDTNQKLDATWVLITQNGGQDWYIVDCIYK